MSGLTINNDLLDQILEEHPYFQLGLMEKSKRLRQQNHIDSLKVTRKCASLFPDRSLLYAYLHEDDQVDKDISRIEKTESKAIEIDDKSSVGVDETTNEKLNPLEQSYIIEAVNQSIQMDAIEYSIERDLLPPDNSKKELEEKENARKVLSFSEWIGASQLEVDLNQEKQNALIEKFIQEKPEIQKLKEHSFYSPSDKGKESLMEDKMVYSETLASIYEQQGNKNLAIKAYRYLMLMNPQKSVYFADLIKKLEEHK